MPSEEASARVLERLTLALRQTEERIARRRFGKARGQVGEAPPVAAEDRGPVAGERAQRAERRRRLEEAVAHDCLLDRHELVVQLLEQPARAHRS